MTGQARAYIENHDLTNQLQVALNYCVKENADDPALFLADYFRTKVGSSHQDETLSEEFKEMQRKLGEKILAQSSHENLKHLLTEANPQEKLMLQDLYEFSSTLNPKEKAPRSSNFFDDLAPDGGEEVDQVMRRDKFVKLVEALGLAKDGIVTAGMLKKVFGHQDGNKEELNLGAEMDLESFVAALGRLAALSGIQGSELREKFAGLIQRQIVPRIKKVFDFTLGTPPGAGTYDMDKMTKFLSFVLYRPVVEQEWAETLTLDRATIAVPPLSEIELPQSTPLPFQAHVIIIPGDCKVMIPKYVGTPLPGAAVSTLTFKMSLSPYATVHFPDDPKKKSGIKMGSITVPGGVSLMLPSNEVAVSLPEGCTMLPGGKKGMSESEDTDLFAGPSIMTPMGHRTTLNIPSGTSLLIPTGMDNLVDIPAGSTITTARLSMSNTILVPSRSVVHLPPRRVGSDPNDQLVVKIPTGSSVKMVSAGDGQQEVMVLASPGTVMQPPVPYQGEQVDEPSPDGTGGGSQKSPSPSRSPPKTPKDRKRSVYVGGPPYVLSQGIPEKIPVPPGTIMVLPPVEYQGAEELARRMVELGPEASGVALGALHVMDVANAMMHLPPHIVSPILRLARPESAAQVVMALCQLCGNTSTQANHMPKCITLISPSVCAAIFSYLPEEKEKRLPVVHALSAYVSLYPSEHTLLYKNMDKQANQVVDAKKLLNNPHVPMRLLIQAISDLAPDVAGRILTGLRSAKTSFLLMRLAARNPYHASKILAWMAEMANMFSQLESASQLHLDVRRAELLTTLSRCSTNKAMLAAAQPLMNLLKNSYGVACTIARTTADVDWRPKLFSRGGTIFKSEHKQIEEHRKSLSASFDDLTTAESNTRMSIGSSKSQRAIAMALTASKLQRSNSTAIEPMEMEVDIDDVADDSWLTSEMKAVDDLEILATTEDVVWGTASESSTGESEPKKKEDAAGEEDGEDEESSSLSVHVRAVELLRAIQEAFAKQRMVHRGLMFVVPVFHPVTGEPWGAVTHIQKNRAVENIMGNIFRKPIADGMTKAVESLKLMSAAMALSAGQMVQDDDEDNPLSPGGDLGTITEEERRLRMDRMLDRHNQTRRKIAAELAKSKASLMVLGEIKQYPNPHMSIKRVLVALVILLEIPGLEKFLDEKLVVWPDDDSLLWTFLRKNLVLNLHHPMYIMRLMQSASKKTSRTKDDRERNKIICEAVKLHIADIDPEALERASKVSKRLYTWVDATLKAKLADVE